jgi:hypothetical protein
MRQIRNALFAKTDVRRLAAVCMWICVAVVVVLGAVWQQQARADQTLDVGSAIDEGAALNFHARERSTADEQLTFRWSRRESEARLWVLPPDRPAVLTLRMLPPPSEQQQRVTISVGAQTLGVVTPEPELRAYQVLFAAPDAQELMIGITSDRRLSDADPRGLGVAIDSVRVRLPNAPTATDLLNEVRLAPFLPLGLLLLVGCALLLRLPRGALVVAPALGPAVGALGGMRLPETQLRLASHVTTFALIAFVAIALFLGLRRVPALLPRTDQRARQWLVVVFLVVLCGSFAPQVRSDGFGYYVYLRSLTMDGDLNFGNEYREWPYQSKPSQNLLRTTTTDHYVNFYSIGPALAWSPLYGAAHLVVLGGKAFGMPWNADGYDQPYLALSTFTSAMSGIVILFACYHICRRWVGPATATLAAISVFLGSNVLYYTMREADFAHALSTAAAAVFVLTWLRLEEQPSVQRWAALGAAAGVMVLMYWISAITLILPALTAVRLLINALRAEGDERLTQLGRLLLGGSLAAGLLLLFVSPQIIAWNVIYGAFFAVPQGNSFITPQRFQGWAMLFSPLHGLLPWTPGLFVGMLGLPLLAGRNRWLTLCLAAGFLAYFLYNAWLQDWHGSGAYGIRRLTLLAPWCAIGLALLFDALRRVRSALPVALAALLIVWTVLTIVRYDLYLLPHNPIRLSQMSLESFYLSREALPAWAFSGWLLGSYVPSGVRGLLFSGFDGEFVAVVAVMALATVVVVMVVWRVSAAGQESRVRDQESGIGDQGSKRMRYARSRGV